MSRRFPPLNSRQLAVLQWIADECPPDSVDGHGWKNTAVALRSRGLVKITKRNGWTAAITEAGRYYLKHREYAPTAPGTRSSQISTPEPQSRRPRRGSSGLVRRLSATEELIADLVARDGVIEVPYLQHAKYELKVRAAMRSGRVPPGKQLVVERRNYGMDCLVRMVDAPAWMALTPDPVPIAASLRKPHSAIAALKDEDSPLALDRVVVQRALSIIQSLAAEAELRGYIVSVPKLNRDRNGWARRETPDHVQISVGGHAIGLQIMQKRESRRHEPTVNELERVAKDPYARVPKRDYAPSQRLQIELTNGIPHRQSRWSDSRSQRLEEVLGYVLLEIELRAAAAEEQRLAKLEAEQRQRIRWENAMRTAKEQYRDEQLFHTLVAQAEAWRQTQLISDYLDAMALKIKELEDPDAEVHARQWRDWAHERLLELNPLNKPLRAPILPDPTPEQLRPYLKGFRPLQPIPPVTLPVRRRRGCLRRWTVLR